MSRPRRTVTSIVPPGAYRVLLALALNGHSFNPEVKVISYRVAE